MSNNTEAKGKADMIELKFEVTVVIDPEEWAHTQGGWCSFPEEAEGDAREHLRHCIREHVCGTHAGEGVVDTRVQSVNEH